MTAIFSAIPGAAIPGSFTPGDPSSAALPIAALPSIKAEAAFGAVGGSLTWTDISAYVRSGSITRPTSRLAGPLYQYQAGTCTLVLKNPDGRFDPDNLSGPYVGTTQLVTQTYTIPGTYSWTAPAGVTSRTDECWGGGGGGGGASTGNHSGKGGGGGEYAKGTLAVTPGNSYTIVVGAAGTKGSSGGGDGGAGGSSSTAGDGGTSVLAHGGSGGTGNHGSSSTGTTPGGSGSTAPTHHNGGPGGGCYQVGSNQAGGGGGGSGGTYTAGQAGQTPTTASSTGAPAAGASAVPGGGPGGDGSNGIGSTGNAPPSGPGGGGGGAASGNTNNHAGGAGWAGQVRLTYLASSSPATQVLPMTPVRVSATWNGVTYPLFTGYADSWKDAGLNNPRYAEVTLSATDAFKVLSGITLPTVTATGSGDGTDDRVNRILDAAGWPSSQRQIATADSTLQTTTYGDSALNLMQLSVDSEMGELYINGSGDVVFRNRNGIFTDARSITPQAVFGDSIGTPEGAGVEVPFTQLQRAYDDTTLVNDVQITRVGGTLQEAQDVASQSKYLFPRSYSRTDLIISTDAEALSYAKLVLYIGLDAEDRFEALGVNALRDPANLYPQALGREIGDRIQVWRRPPNVSAFSKDVFIRGITHAWDISSQAWLTTWTLQLAARYSASAPTY